MVQTTSALLTTAQQRLVDYVRELARDRGMTPAAALAALRAGIYAGDDAVALGTSELAGRWDLLVSEVEELAELLDGEPAANPGAGKPDRALAALAEMPPARSADSEPETPRSAFTRGLRELAGFLDHHPEVELPYLHNTRPADRPTLPVYLVGYKDDENRRALAAIARALASTGRRVHKYADDGNHPGYYVWAEFGSLAFVARADRDQVCERVVVGTETVEVEEDACPEPGCGAALTTVDVGTAGREVTVCSVDAGHYQAAQPGKRVAKTDREVVEWRCTPLLAGADGER